MVMSAPSPKLAPPTRSRYIFATVIGTVIGIMMTAFGIIYPEIKETALRPKEAELHAASAAIGNAN
jgi:hypothetical protein